jgi:hypothetical protein
MRAQGGLRGSPNGRVERPVRQPSGRQVQLRYHKEVIQKARAEQSRQSRRGLYESDRGLGRRWRARSRMR